MDKRHFFLLLICASALFGCSGTYRTHYENLKLAFSDPIDPTPTMEYIKSSTIDLALVKSGSRPWARIALAHNELGMNKWISADKGMLIIQDGVVVKTLGFDNDLLYTSSVRSIPLNKARLGETSEWQRIQDWEAGEYGYLVSSSFNNVGSDQIILMGKTFDTVVVKEAVTYQTPARHWKLKNTWENTYWYDAASGELLQSSQQASPFSDRFKIKYISRAVRLM